MQLKSLFTGILCLLACGSFAAGGKTYQTAASLSASQTATLQDDGDGEGVAWFKVTLSKGKAYSIWLEGSNVEDFDFYIDSDPGMTHEDTPMADFTDGDFGDGYSVAWMYANDWDEEDPPSWTYYVEVSGKPNTSVKLGFASGIKSFKKPGESDNPTTLTFSDDKRSLKAKLLTEEADAYYTVAKLTAGNKYKVWTSNGTAAKPLDVLTDCPSADYAFDPDKDNVNNTAMILRPSETDTYQFVVVGSNAYEFVLNYQKVPSRKPAVHNPAALDKSGYEASFVPGARVYDTDYFDLVIDRNLYSLAAKKGERWFFETSGATVPLAMEVYDKDGKVLCRNTTLGNGSLDCRAAFEAPSDGMYYVGVCNPALGEGEEATGAAVMLKAAKCETVGLPDAFDSADDADSGASALAPKPATYADDPREVGDAHGPHALNARDWCDSFRIGGRKDVVYCLKADFIGESTDLNLAVEVVKVLDKGTKPVECGGGLSPQAENPLYFAADENADYIVRVSVDEGVGLDYPAYTLYASAYSATGEDLGLLKVTTPGSPGAQWSVNSEKTKYKDGTGILIAGSPTVKFYDVSGFKTPASQKVTVAPGAAETLCEGRYVDNASPADDAKGGAKEVKPANKSASAKRTLWKGDEHDWFKFAAKTGTFYNFNVKNNTEGDYVCDAVMTILDAAGNPIDADAVDALERKKFSLNGGTYYIDVHPAGTSLSGGSYSLGYSSATVGSIAFAKTAVSAKENASSVELTVKRTASEGVVRVNYATVAGTAEPGKEYYPASGTLVWKNGDKADKKIKVRLIPDLTATYEKNKSFSVKLWSMDKDDLADDEYLAQITASKATVTLTEVSKAVPGTVSVTAINGKATTAKKPVATTTAGGEFAFTVARTGDSDGKICVKWETAKGKAVPGTDFEAASGYLVWEDGEDEDKAFVVKTKPSKPSDFTASKNFTVKFSAQTSGDWKGCARPVLSASSAALTIGNDHVKKPIADYIKAMNKADGVALKASGTWVVDSEGRIASDRPASGKKDVLTFTLAGCGLFSVEPVLTGDATLTCQVGKEAAFACGAGEIVRLVANGNQNVVFTLVGKDGTGSVAFKTYADGKPYGWVSLASLVPTPAVKAVVPTDRPTLDWIVPEGPHADELAYRVRFGTDAKKLSSVYEGSATSCAMPELSAGKAYYWIVDAKSGEGGWVSGKTTWSFSAATAGAPVTTIASSDGAEATDVWGDPIVADGDPVSLIQGVKVSWQLGDEDETATSYKLVNGKLPDGLKLDSKKGTVSGAPTKTGGYSAVLQAINGKKLGETIALRFKVSALDLAAGTFYGTLQEDGSSLETGFQKAASVVFTSATSGKLSAKVTLGGKSYSFSGTGFDLAFDRDDESAGFTAQLQAELKMTTKIAGESYANTLVVTLGNGSSKSLEALGLVGGTAELTMAVPSADGKSVLCEETAYRCDLYRDNSKLKDYLATLTDFVGYYTAALAPIAAEDGQPQGNGYLTLTVDAKGKAKVAGMLADGNKFSFSSIGLLVGDLSSPRECSFHVPLYVGKKPYVFGGVAKIGFASDEFDRTASVLDASSELIWNSDASTFSEETSGFMLNLSPAGGWYSTVYSLQRYYLDNEFELDGATVELNGDSISLKSTAGTTFSGLKISFTRKTGLLSGTLTLGGEKNLKHYGVLPLCRDALSPLGDDVWTAGFFTHKRTDGSRTWTESLPFNIQTSEIDPDWTEVDPPEAE